MVVRSTDCRAAWACERYPDATLVRAGQSIGTGLRPSRAFDIDWDGRHDVVPLMNFRHPIDLAT